MGTKCILSHRSTRPANKQAGAFHARSFRVFICTDRKYADSHKPSCACNENKTCQTWPTWLWGRAQAQTTLSATAICITLRMWCGKRIPHIHGDLCETKCRYVPRQEHSALQCCGSREHMNTHTRSQFVHHKVVTKLSIVMRIARVSGVPQRLWVSNLQL